MARHLSGNLGNVDPNDNLFSGLDPAAIVGEGIISKGTAAVTLKRGTVLAKNKTGKLVILGTTASEGDSLTPDCVLTDDTEIGTSADVVATVFISGCFNPDALIVDAGYTITTADKDKLRERNIYLRNRWA